MSQIFNLYRLQQLDSQLDSSFTKLIELELLLKNEDELRESQKYYDQQHERLDTLNKSLSIIEHEVNQQHIKIEQSEATLYGGKVKNPKELKDLENEVASLKKYLKILEERELEALIDVEEQTKVTEQAHFQLKQSIQAYELKNADCIHEIEQLRKEITHLENEKHILTQGIPKEYLDRYLQIRKIKKGIAVTRIIDKSCAACGTSLTGGLIQDSRLPDKIVLCPSCGRIIYGG